MISHSTTWFDSQNRHTTQEHQSAVKIWGWRIAEAGGASALDCHHSMANTVTLINHGPFRAVSASGPAPAPTTQKAEALIGSLNASLL